MILHLLIPDCVGVRYATVTGFDTTVIGVHPGCGINRSVITESIDELPVQGSLLSFTARK